MRPEKFANGHLVRIAAGFCAMLLAALALTWPALTGPFVFDDFPNLQHLSSLQGQLDWASLAHYVSLFEGTPGRPLSMLSFVINDAAWPSEPWSFKYTNLLLHLLVGVAVFGLSRTLANLRTDPGNADHVAVLTAAAWLLHPLQLSTSMLVVQRMTQLSALFAILGLWGYVALARNAERMPQALAALVVLGLGSVLAVLCKETGALVPLFAIVINATLLHSLIDAFPVDSRRLLKIGTALPVMALTAGIATKWEALTGYGSRDFTIGERVLTQGRALVDYLTQIVLPRIRGTGIYHDDYVVSRGLLEPGTTLPSLLLVVALAGMAFAIRRRSTIFAFSMGWFLAGHLLESTIFPLELYFEHRNYLPMVGPLFGLAWTVCHAPQRWRRIAWGLAALWLVHASILTSIQARIWGDDGAIATIWAREHPRSQRAIQQLADYHVRHGNHAAGAALLLGASDDGIGGVSFPLQALIVACANGDRALAGESQRRLRAQIPTAKHELSVLAATTALREYVARDACPGIAGPQTLLELTAGLLARPAYRTGKSRAYLHVERARLFQAMRNLNATMLELEGAAAAYPSADLAMMGAAILASAGLLEDAEAWARRGLHWTPRGVRGLLSGDEARLDKMIELLEEARMSGGRD